MCKIKERCSDTECHNLFKDIRDNRPLIFYCDREFVWATESNIVCCTRNDRRGLAWFKTGIWKLIETRKGSEKGKHHLCREEENFYILY
jgi:hypothetical protein